MRSNQPERRKSPKKEVLFLLNDVQSAVWKLKNDYDISKANMLRWADKISEFSVRLKACPVGDFSVAGIERALSDLRREFLKKFALWEPRHIAGP